VLKHEYQRRVGRKLKVFQIKSRNYLK